MYRVGQIYKIQLKNSITYTALILDEDNSQIKIQDRYGEEMIITKSEIIQSKLIAQNSTGADHEKKGS